eukprot:931695_1
MASDNIETVQIFNIDKDISTTSSTSFISTSNKKQNNENIDNDSYIVSDADEELLILVQFKQITNLQSMTIYASTNGIDVENVDVSEPKKVNVFKIDNLRFNFDDVRSRTPNKTVHCSTKRLSKGQYINLQKEPKNAIQFKNTQCLAIYIESNQNDTENTLVHSISLRIKHNDDEKQIEHDPTHPISAKKRNEYNNAIDLSTINYLRKHEKEIVFDKTDQVNQQNMRELDQIYASMKITNSSTAYNDGLLKGCCKEPIIARCEDLNECKSLHRIKHVLLRYDSYIDRNHNDELKQNANENDENIELLQPQHSNSINSVFDEECDDTTLLDDFNHLLLDHSRHFEEIHYILSNDKMCSLSSCYRMQRSHRDRFELREKDNKIQEMYFNCNDSRDVVYQQILDRIHCHYVHSFDILYKLNKKDRAEVARSGDDTFKTLLALIKSKKNALKNIPGLERLSLENNHKFNTIVEDEEHKNDKSNHIRYSFGYKYFYWKYYQNNFDIIDTQRRFALGEHHDVVNADSTLNDWYIPQKYNNLEDELLNNPLCTISKYQWNIYYNEAFRHLNASAAKSITCSQIGGNQHALNNNISLEIYGISRDQPISQEHLISMMVYCGADVLQSEFSKTYRKVDVEESYNSLKKRHENYHHLGRLLTEIAECFGCMSDNLNSLGRLAPFDSGGLYHGMAINARFDATNTRIYGPLSASTDFMVALNFASSTGVVIDLRLGFDWKYGGGMLRTVFSYFDASWLSNYPNEAERFFI